MKKILAILLCLTLILSVFAGCDNNTDTSSVGEVSSQTVLTNDDLIDKETGEIINIGSTTTLKVLPDEIGMLTNPVVTGLEAWPDVDVIAWKEENYGIIYDYDKCDGGQRQAKWIAAFVAGDAYDVITMLHQDFPIVAQKGLLQPLEKIMPVYDENYFSQTVTEFFSWKGRVYGVNPYSSPVNTYGVHFNQTYFDNLGMDTPLDYYNRGEWTFDTFLKLTKEMLDQYPCNYNFDYLCEGAVASNGGAFLRYTDNGAELTLKDPKTVEAMEWVGQIYKLCSGNVHDSYQDFAAGKNALHVERLHQINHFRSTSNYEFGWVPFPKGPSGDGTQSGYATAWGIGKGAKNIEGAMAYIASTGYYETWLEENNVDPDPDDTRTEEEKQMLYESAKNSVVNALTGFGFGLYSFNQEAQNIGYAAAVEKHTPSLQAKINEILEIETEVGKIDFEDQGVFNFDTKDSEYPFVNVIASDKFTYGTNDMQSLNIDLTGVDAFAPILYTKPELFKLQNGGQYKVTFKLYSKVDLPIESLAVAARTTNTLDGAPTFGLTWLEAKADTISEVEVYLNINDVFYGDLAVVLLGSESVDGLNVVIDDFRVQLIDGE